MTTTPDLWRSGFIDNTTLPGSRDSGVVAATGANQFFAVWVDRDNFNGGIDTIIARNFDSNGNPLTGEVLVTPNIGIDRDDPAVARLPIANQGDGLAVAYTRHGGTEDVFLHRLNGALTDLNGEITIAMAGITDHPSITSFADGSLLVAYTFHGAGSNEINARRVDATGSVGPVQTPFAPGTFADDSDLATLANG